MQSEARLTIGFKSRQSHFLDEQFVSRKCGMADLNYGNPSDSEGLQSSSNPGRRTFPQTEAISRDVVRRFGLY
jgi:hypothetical protein